MVVIGEAENPIVFQQSQSGVEGLRDSSKSTGLQSTRGHNEVDSDVNEELQQ